MDHIKHKNFDNQLVVSSQADSNHKLLSFSGISQALQVQNPVDVLMPLQLLAQSTDFGEYWSDSSPVKMSATAHEFKVRLHHSNHHLVLVYETEPNQLAQTVSQVYAHAYQQSQTMGFEYLLRTWNYIDKINDLESGSERYQVFCSARHQVLEQLELLEAPNPAATAIGGHHGVNQFVFLFAHQPGTVIENKRQVSAWQYPKHYSPRQPRFSRALQVGGLLMCSGTASVVGHETIHLGNLAAQLNECMINIQSLLGDSDLRCNLDAGIFRFYLRDKNLASQVVQWIGEHGITQFMVLEGDVCRENLLIECEALFQ